MIAVSRLDSIKSNLEAANIFIGCQNGAQQSKTACSLKDSIKRW